ncbi:TonB-dependent receptor domain-containing protein [Phenylobacterium immobile]|uniref:TonB-dependent receptor domain-containing protein n=1 Tax=Phenylobacterium immobile TaxID=21 RepID=UPI000AFA8934|nr:TonB-dependent receptor [Phenylobacterium immobile]
MGLRAASAIVIACTAIAAPAAAQRADENAARAAGDAFGTNIGNEKVGLYTQMDVRGFSPTAAGNLRLEGLYFDLRPAPPPRLVAGSQVRVGLAAQSYPFPAPTGIVDFSLRPTDRAYAASLIQAGPHTAYALEYEIGRPIKPGRLGVAWAIGLRRDEELAHDDMTYLGMGLNATWRPTARIELKPYLGTYTRFDKLGVGQVFPGAAVLPPVPEGRSFQPDWTRQGFAGYNAGLITNMRLTDSWSLKAGAQRFLIPDRGPISDSLLNVDANGVAAVRRYANQPPNHTNTWSGEARLTGQHRLVGLDHLVHIAFRGRDVDRTFGGAAQVNFTNVPIGMDNAPVVAPSWTYAVQSQELIGQYTVAASYLVGRPGLGNVGVGLQRVDYRRTLTTPGRADIVSIDKPMFWNGTALVTPLSNLAFYGGYTEGLEEAPFAPEAAVNAQEAPPAIHTKQVEAGVRYAFTPALRLVAGYFDIEKPYINLDSGRLWRVLGVERHQGFELSLTGQVLPGLNVVGGYVHMNPVVSGEAVGAGLIGAEPVGQPRDTGKVNFDFRRTPTTPLSFEGAITYFGARAASARVFAQLGGRQPRAPGYVVFDLGMRYRFTLAGHRSTLRLQALNILEAQKWVVPTAGGMSVSPPRRVFVSLATDY